MSGVAPPSAGAPPASPCCRRRRPRPGAAASAAAARACRRPTSRRCPRAAGATAAATGAAAAGAAGARAGAAGARAWPPPLPPRCRRGPRDRRRRCRPGRPAATDRRHRRSVLAPEQGESQAQGDRDGVLLMVAAIFGPAVRRTAVIRLDQARRGSTRNDGRPRGLIRPIASTGGRTMRRPPFRSTLDRHPGRSPRTFGCAASERRHGGRGGSAGRGGSGSVAARGPRRQRQRWQQRQRAAAPAAAARRAAAAAGTGGSGTGGSGSGTWLASGTGGAAAAPVAAARAPAGSGGAADCRGRHAGRPDHAHQGQRLRRRRLPEPDVQGADHARAGGRLRGDRLRAAARLHPQRRRGA